MAKQSAGVEQDNPAIGHSPFRPYTACKKSACSVLVGRPVLGPPRCTFTMISGNSVMTASPIDSDFNATPGPLVPVEAIAPVNAAPIEAAMAAISSSAWNVFTPNACMAARASRIVLAGVIG